MGGVTEGIERGMEGMRGKVGGGGFLGNDRSRIVNLNRVPS